MAPSGAPNHFDLSLPGAQVPERASSSSQISFVFLQSLLETICSRDSSSSCPPSTRQQRGSRIIPNAGELTIKRFTRSPQEECPSDKDEERMCVCVFVCQCVCDREREREREILFPSGVFFVRLQGVEFARRTDRGSPPHPERSHLKPSHLLKWRL